jgi:hypothetical protein
MAKGHDLKRYIVWDCSLREVYEFFRENTAFIFRVKE